MIVLDTNVISELMRKEPDSKVLHWVNGRDSQTFFMSAITAAELLSGVEQRAAGRLRSELGAALSVMLDQVFRGRILPFDAACAPHFARIFALRRKLGIRIEEPDAMIAATCARHGFHVATRDTGGFAHCGIDVINPWTD